MHSTPLVSVALCTYNGEEFLREQLDSIVNQSYDSLEIIVRDDMSSDSTLEIVKEYKEKSNREIIIYESDINLGYYRNFEKAISPCTGDFIALADQDDVWHLDKIEKLVTAIGDNDLIYCNSEVIDENGQQQNVILSDLFNFVEGNEPKKLMFHNCVSAHAMLFRKHILQFALPFPEFMFHDWWIAYVAMATGRVTYIKDVLVKYRVHNENTTDIKKYTSNQRPPQKKGRTLNKWGAFRGNRNVVSMLSMFEQFPYHRETEKRFLKKFIKVQRKREDEIISWDYYQLWKENGLDLLACRQMSHARKLRYIRSKLVGMKLKKWYYQLRGKYVMSDNQEVI